MRRRFFLSSLGLTALAGCSSNENSDNPNSGEGGFELVSLDVPRQVPSTAQVTFRFQVRNTSSQRNTFTSPIEERQGDTWTQVDEVSLPLDSGETGTTQSSQLPFPYLGTRQYRLAAVNRTWSISTVPLQLQFRDQYVVPDGLLISVLGGSFETTYPQPDNETARNETVTSTPTTPSSDNIWLIMRVDIRNRSQDNPVQSPDPSEFTLTTNGQRRQPNQAIATDPYESRMLDPRMVIRGSFVYSVPSDTAPDDVRMSWETSYSEGRLKAIWSTSPSD
jgi:hypothetical protein